MSIEARAEAGVLLAIDTGGTFTDVIAWVGGGLRVLKVPSTRPDPAAAVLAGIREILAQPEPQPQRVFTLVHGSTVATNTLLERTGARVALVTNRGFEDVIEIGRQDRPQLYALVGSRPPPLVAREDRHGIAGRLGSGGEQIAPLDDDELAALPDRLTDAEAVAVCLLHSYADSAHEERVAAALDGLDVPLSISSRLLPEYREYERTAAAVVNAYVAPRMDRYLRRIGEESGARRVRIMGSAGGALPIARARREPIHTVLSGPAGGVTGALHRARAAGIQNIITFDMGGTSTDVSLCHGRPQRTRELVIAGIPIAVPVLDIHTVGAGGGSVAWIDAGAALRVGPQSAGADPGPICYGAGGRDITVTDANVWLGRLPADAFVVAGRALDREAIQAPLRSLADTLGLTPEATAQGVLDVADAAMAGALRVISVERGHDPAAFTLVPFGGAAGLHAADLAARLGIARILLPPDPGVLSALGMLVAPIRKEASRTVLLEAPAGSPGDVAPQVEHEFAALEADVLSALMDEGVSKGEAELERVVDARYRGQSHELRVGADGWVERFHEAHERRYGYASRHEPVVAVTLRVVASAHVPAPPAPALSVASGPPRVRALCDVVRHGDRLTANRYERAALCAGHRLEGPAILTEYSATAWIPPGWVGEVLQSGAILLSHSNPD